MKNLFASLLMLVPVATFAQIDLSLCGRYEDRDQLQIMDILPVEGETGTCFYIMYMNNAGSSEDEIGELQSGNGNCKKTANRYTVTLDDNAKKMTLEFVDGVPPGINYYDGKTMVCSLKQALNYDALMEQYRLEEELMNAEIEEISDYEAADEDYTSPTVYMHPKGYALSMLMYSASEGYFAAVAIAEGTSCDLNSLEGVIRPGKEPGLYIAEKEGCVFAEIRISGNTAVLTEKSCKSVDRSRCASLSGTYTIEEN